jgi:GTPase-associated system helical domain
MSKLEVLFGAWLKMVLPDSGITERDLRLGIIRTFVETVSKDDILDLVLAFYSMPTEEPAIERLRSAMRTVDTSFGAKDNAELSVIAAGVLYEMFEHEGDLATAGALAVLCADFGALSSMNHVTELVSKARECIGLEGIRVREESVQLPNLRDALNSALDLEKDDAEEPEADEEGPDGDEALRRVVKVLCDYGDKVGQSVVSIEARRAEQSDILYWLLSGRRQIGGVPLKGLKKEQAALLIAVELANLTRQIPGPASTTAILSTLLDQCKNPTATELTLEACIKSIDPADGAAYLAKRNVVHPIISPISFALVKAEETDWQDGWQSAFKTQTKKPANTKYPVLIIAEQLYRETLLARSLGEN